MRVVTRRKDENYGDYLIRVVAVFLEENKDLMDHNVIYDETECDAYALHDDLESWFYEIIHGYEECTEDHKRSD